MQITNFINKNMSIIEKKALEMAQCDHSDMWNELYDEEKESQVEIYVMDYDPFDENATLLSINKREVHRSHEIEILENLTNALGFYSAEMDDSGISIGNVNRNYVSECFRIKLVNIEREIIFFKPKKILRSVKHNGYAVGRYNQNKSILYTTYENGYKQRLIIKDGIIIYNQWAKLIIEPV